MSISGFLENFSLPELLRLIDLGSKSGRLILQIRSAPERPDLVGLYHIWFQEGQLVTVIDRSQPQSLIKQIENKGWLDEASPKKLERLHLLQVPLGKYLQQEELLTEQQLNELFQERVAQLYQLFEVPVGCFLFHEISPKSDKPRKIPWLEMTGNRIRATEVSLNALRLQQNWDIFAEQLPESHYALTQLVQQPDFKLIPIEWQVWEFANGKNSLKAIAGKINQPLLKVQKTALSLMMVGLVDEMPIVYTPNNLTPSKSDRLGSSLVHVSSESSSLQTISQNRLQNLNNKLKTSFLRTVVDFLRSRFGQSS
ncbi:MAG: DUF4388 domain-containing protein [Xenococcaceae cyanobacterium]